MIEEFGHERLKRRLAFLESRAKAHRADEINRRWHLAAAATLLRDAGAVALMLSDIGSARHLLRESGDLFLKLGFVAGFQLLYVSGALDTDEDGPANRIDTFSRAFFEHRKVRTASLERASNFNEESFQPPQLLRVYQALAGGRVENEKWIELRGVIRRALIVNATMPVGSARIPAVTYLAVFDRLAGRESQASEALPGGVGGVLRSLAQRRAELIMAARRDNFHWKALLRPAELIDFDLLALLLAGIRRGQDSKLIATAFAERDAMTALPQVLATALKG